MPLDSGRQGWRLAVILVFALFLSSCDPPGVVRAAKPVLDVEPPTEPYPRQANAPVSISSAGCELKAGESGDGFNGRGHARDWDLRGNPDFEPESLGADVQCWYEQLWSVLVSPERSRSYTGRARSDDLYLYSRPLNTHINALLIALRVTGDLALLDEVDRLAQHMRSTLDDSWRGPAALDNDGVDGYLNWVWGQSSSRTHRGRDLHVTDEMRTHAMVAQFAWAFRANEDLGSPNGVDYRERADFWQTYLTEHFEAKWRDRMDVPWPAFPFVTRPHTHETLEFIRYNHYLHLLTGRPEYAREAARLSELSFENFEVAQTDDGAALVVPRSLLALGGKEDFLMPSTYVRYVYSSALDLHFSGVEPWEDDEVLQMLAKSLSAFIMDNGSEDFARDMGGGAARAGVRASAPSDWPRFGPDRYNISPYVLLSAWDESRKVVDVSRQIYANTAESERDIFIPIGMLVDLMVN